MTERSSLEKGLAILQELASSDDGMNLSDLARATDLNRTTAYRLCTVLEREGWVQSNDAGKESGRRQVVLGPRALGLTALASNKHDPGVRLKPLMESLARQVDETVHLGVLDDISVIHIASAVPQVGPHLALRHGARALAHVTALGKAMLATYTDRDIRRKYRYEQIPSSSPTAIQTRTALLEDLARIRARGYAIDDEESRIGVRCVGAPIFGFSDRAIFALSVTSMPARLSNEHLVEVAQSVSHSARLATEALGGRFPIGWIRPESINRTVR
jgi:DNA-binding IclR family transcriptional regulator